VTEELWQAVAPKLGVAETTIMLRPYPRAADLSASDGQSEAAVEWLKSVISSVRRIRSELNVAPSRQIALLVAEGDTSDRERVARFNSQLRFLCKLESIDCIASADSAPASAAGVVGTMKLLVPLEGLVDLGAERTRLDKEINRVEGEIAKCRGKLASETFVANAPAAVVEQERGRLADWTTQLGALTAQRAKLG
jgi:valyl-tRNA synthetase